MKEVSRMSFFYYLLLELAMTADADDLDGKYKVIAWQNDKNFKLTIKKGTVRLKKTDTPTAKEDIAAALFIQDKTNVYFIKYHQGYLCKKSSNDRAVVSCKNKNDRYTAWKTTEKGSDVFFISTLDGNNYLKKVGYDKRPDSNGFYIHAVGGKPKDNDSSFLWTIDELDIRQEPPRVEEESEELKLAVETVSSDGNEELIYGDVGGPIVTEYDVDHHYTQPHYHDKLVMYE